MVQIVLDEFLWTFVIYLVSNYIGKKSPATAAYCCLLFAVFMFNPFRNVSLWSWLLCLYWTYKWYKNDPNPSEINIETVAIVGNTPGPFTILNLRKEFTLLQGKKELSNNFRVLCYGDNYGLNYSKFTEESWGCYQIVRELKRSGADVIVYLLCPNTLAFYHGYTMYLMRQNLFITSYDSSRDSFSHIQPKHVSQEDVLKISEEDKKLFKCNFTDYTGDNEIMLFINFNKSKRLTTVTTFGKNVYTIESTNEEEIQVTNENYSRVIKSIINRINPWLKITNIWKIGIAFEAPSSIAFGIGLYLKSYMFHETCHRLYLGEPTDETTSKYLFAKLTDLHSNK